MNKIIIFKEYFYYSLNFFFLSNSLKIIDYKKISTFITFTGGTNFMVFSLSYHFWVIFKFMVISRLLNKIIFLREYFSN